MRAVADCSSGSYLEFASRHVARSAHVRADGFAGCRCGPAGWPGLDSRPFREGDPDASLPVVHHPISNFKSFVLGAFHGVTRERLQGYMDEFCWRYGRRRDRDPFGSLLEEPLEASKIPREGLGALFAPQAPQPAAPTWKERRSARQGLCSK